MSEIMYKNVCPGYENGCRWYDWIVGGMTKNERGMSMRVFPKEYVRVKVQECISSGMTMDVGNITMAVGVMNMNVRV